MATKAQKPQRHPDATNQVPTSVPPVDPVRQTLSVRGSRYGTFVSNAVFAQRIKDLFREVSASNPHYANLSESQSAVVFEAVDQIAQKLCRMANGDPLYLDNLHDIAGYATLAEDHLGTEGGWK